MSVRTLLWPLAGLFLLIAACIPTRYTLDGLPDEQLRFGSGGGFTGAFHEYLLLQNGQVFLFESNPGKKDTFELQSLSRTDTRMVFRQLDSLRLHKYDFNHPGNMTYFIRQTDELIDHTVQWGDARWAIREVISQYHAGLKAMMDNRKVIKDPKEEKEEPKEPTFW